MKKRLIAMLLALVLVASCVPVMAAEEAKTRILFYGLYGDDVKAVQERLKYYEYYNGEISGKYDQNTRKAVKEFQSANNLVADGKVGPLTLGKLNSDNAYSKSVITKPVETISYGMKGEKVTAVQERLIYYGYFPYFADGEFGSTTMEAVAAFQRANGLGVDGKVGKRTLYLLNSDFAVHKKQAVENTTLEVGSYGEEVEKLQRALRDTYYYVGPIDGIFGVEVLNAVTRFQASANLARDGKVGPKTRNALLNRAAAIFNGGIPVRQLESGARGYDVYVLQQKLVSLNYLKIAPSGYYSTETIAAVKAFQEANNLKVDGKVGTLTRRYLWPTAVSKKEDAADDEKRTPDEPTSERTLRPNYSGDDVANLQMRLKAAGYLLGDADGIYGETTEKAVEKLQKAYGLKQDGICGPQTWSVVKALSTENAEQKVVDPEKRSTGAATHKLRAGNHGTQVMKLQQNLITLGFLAAGEDDGRFGPITTQAVRDFQTAMGLKVDGIAGTNTFAAINEQLGIQYDY